jgi:hypothetical protein
VLSIIRDHSSAKKKTLAIRRTEQFCGPATGKPHVRQSQCVTNGSAKETSNDVCLRHTVRDGQIVNVSSGDLTEGCQTAKASGCRNSLCHGSAVLSFADAAMYHSQSTTVPFRWQVHCPCFGIASEGAAFEAGVRLYRSAHSRKYGVFVCPETTAKSSLMQGIPRVPESCRGRSLPDALNPNGVPHDRYGFLLRHCRLWNPVGVQRHSNFATWGAPRCGDPRLCCETRTGLKHRISTNRILHELKKGAYSSTEMWVMTRRAGGLS